MAHHEQHNTFGRLDELDDYKVADGYPDIRGWDVITAAGQKVGKVDELIVDTTQMRVRYIDVDLDRSIRDEIGDTADSVKKAATPGPDGVERGHTLLPIGSARLDDDKDNVIIDRIDLGTIRDLPRYDGRSLTTEYESSLRNRFGAGAGDVATGAYAAGATGAVTGSGNVSASEMARGEEMARWYETEHYDDQRLFASRRNRNRVDGDLDDTSIGDLGISRDRTGDEQRLTLSEEQLAIDKRQVQAGEARVRKTVETEHVQETVPLMREEVTVERRPISGDVSAAQIGDKEIRVQLQREEAVAEKRVVPREEIIVRKNAVTTDKTVEADLRRERVDVDRSGDARLTGADTLRGDAYDNSGNVVNRTDRGERGLGDRIADAADDVKDRFDGNPASRPGRDATDRPGR